ncbi:splicing factor 3B subunit 1 [Monocercomonoides exilis]|uniref:splicing factor 3B subunit 1 n=1 Tax=Monocercomonoides exilis TaxID=2049356 RepID=UPI003559759C|nr:splicing factor 3B subunit 1 [Monocercomonoides exilis]|eukprot:MONOS_721.1-p1 / transcript=MONOS_721.1 / gene=MONOS_721 / organism=Monocercomonoides_exilis_PA203 / gene_product=splicing factor 3B subunit 1 / transcript_product=splicing factor 3B subunit 1 / location=Mono_scaffold00012:76437-79782(-) / protein_length=1030 / sequence_SO=supercontig / SO=protein_coding / is_pseudo=false
MSSSRWDKTPVVKSGTMPEIASRWDQPDTQQINRTVAPPTGMGMLGTPMATPLLDASQSAMLVTPGPLSPRRAAIEQVMRARWEREMDERNRPLSDDELDAMLPATGYKILPPPEDYVPLMTPARRLTSTPSLASSALVASSLDVYRMPARVEGLPMEVSSEYEGISVQPEDKQLFAKLLRPVDDESILTPEDQKEREVLGLLLKIKSGTPQQRRTSLRIITEKAHEFGAAVIFDNLLQMMKSPTLDDQERHLLVKVLNRVLFKLDDAVRPYVHKILMVTEPLLIDEDFYARIEGREAIANVAKAAGLATMIAEMRPDIDNPDDYMRNTTARAFAVVGVALGVNSLLPFLKAVCLSKRSWHARHTGIKIVQQIAILQGCGILPHLTVFVKTIEKGLEDREHPIRTQTALSLAALAEAAAPYGFASFTSVLRPLVSGTAKEKGKTLAAYLKCLGFILPLADEKEAEALAKLILPVLRKEFATPDNEMKKIVLKVAQQMIQTNGVTAETVREKLFPDFMRYFWVPRMAIERRSASQLVDTTVDVAAKIGGADVLTQIVLFMKDPSEAFRKMTCETIDKIVAARGMKDVDDRLEHLIVDGLLFCLSEMQSNDVGSLSGNAAASSTSFGASRLSTNNVVLNCIGTVATKLGARFHEHIPKIVGAIYWRLNNKDARVRQQAADLVSKVASVVVECGEEQVLLQISAALNESLGEEFPEVLGSILGALKSIVNVVGIQRMNPPISDLLPRLTPILRNRHEKVAENCIDLVGRIAERGAEYVSPREWMRICFELLDMLKAPKKGIRRAATNTFGFIARAVDPHEVLTALLKNLRVQERTNRVCTTIAIAIVADQCQPFTVLPALMNEYKMPELNVQNGVLKSLSFMFEYIGEMAKDYVYAITTLLENALTDRDLVHRQTAAAALKHLSLGVTGLGKEDAITHLFNCLWPNIFETSPHVIQAVFDAIDGCRVCLGPLRILQYTLQGLFHPARKVRDVYWRIFNMIYMGHQDALVPAYPIIPDTSSHIYCRPELELLF